MILESDNLITMKAIKMNRTLVVPPFFKHHFDLTLQIHGAHGTDRDVLPPEVRVDPAAISESFYITARLNQDSCCCTVVSD